MEQLTQNSSPSISVVMCTYNGGPFIDSQVQSLLEQTLQPHEILIVDDRSTDDTVDKLNAFAEKHQLIRVVVNQANLGFNRNFEKAIGLAKGNIISICDQDDIWHSQKLEVMMREWAQQTLLSYCDSSKFKGSVPPRHIKPEAFIRKIEGTDPRLLAIRNTVSGHAMMFRRELLQLASPFPEKVYYDWWLAVVAIANGGISHIPYLLVYQREHESNQTLQKFNSTKEDLIAYKIMLDRHLEQFRNIPNLDKNQQQFFNQLYELWHRSLTKKRNFALFQFLMKHRDVLYSYKKRKFPFISQFKHSLRYAMTSVPG